MKVVILLHSNSTYQGIVTETATVPRRHKFQKQNCTYETGRAYTSVDIDVSTDIDCQLPLGS